MEIVPIKNNVNKMALDVLHEAIAKVESGEIAQIALSWVCKDGVISGDISGGDNGLLMWAAIEHSARSFYNDVVVGD